MMLTMAKRPVFICSDCGKDICEGDFYLDILGEQICMGCLENHIKYAVKTDEAD